MRQSALADRHRQLVDDLLDQWHARPNQLLFRINAGVPVIQALSHASDLLHVAKLLASDAAMVRYTDIHAWAAHFLQDMSKAIIDDVLKVLDAPCSNRA